LQQSIADALTPIIEQYLSEPRKQIVAIEGRMDIIEHKFDQEGLSRSQHRAIQKAVSTKVQEICREMPGATPPKHFANVYGSLKDWYDVGSYMDIPKDKFMHALQLISKYDGSGRNWWK